MLIIVKFNRNNRNTGLLFKSLTLETLKKLTITLETLNQRRAIQLESLLKIEKIEK